MIFCVEDDSSIRELIVYTLKNIGFDAMGFDGADEFFAAFKKNEPSLVILDIMLPGKDGIEILKDIKFQRSNMPVIMLTAKSAEYDKVMSLDLGADDYITKPFGMMELISRIKAVLRRSGNDENEVISAGDISVNLKKHAVFVKNQKIELTCKEYELLRILIERKGNVVTREELLRIVWGYDFEGESRTLDVHIRTLRQKLGESAGTIATVRSVGYRAGEE